jgi:hypothetical protein
MKVTLFPPMYRVKLRIVMVAQVVVCPVSPSDNVREPDLSRHIRILASQARQRQDL